MIKNLYTNAWCKDSMSNQKRKLETYMDKN